jgi:hypothetical protein
LPIEDPVLIQPAPDIVVGVMSNDDLKAISVLERPQRLVAGEQDTVLGP